MEIFLDFVSGLILCEGDAGFSCACFLIAPAPRLLVLELCQSFIEKPAGCCHFISVLLQVHKLSVSPPLSVLFLSLLSFLSSTISLLNACVRVSLCVCCLLLFMCLRVCLHVLSAPSPTAESKVCGEPSHSTIRAWLPYTHLCYCQEYRPGHILPW